ncbi:MAG: RNA 2',3'-cyclic phosphodiesterase [Terracidiphilus sp.]
MRLFVGIPLADAVARELGNAIARLREGESSEPGSRLRWTAPESWHITLQFLGNATQEQLECLKTRLGEVRASAVPVKLGELGCFDRAGVFFADVTVTLELAALERSVVAATGPCGFAAETRPFHPHITLARAKGHGRGTELRAIKSKIRNQPAFARFTATEFVLYESHLAPGGAHYEARMRMALAGRPDTMEAANH